jgi:hypothetical protein
MGRGSQRTPKAAPSKNLGPALKWSDAAIDALTEISEADIEEAAAYWRANAPASFKALLDAQPGGRAGRPARRRAGGTSGA